MAFLVKSKMILLDNQYLISGHFYLMTVTDPCCSNVPLSGSNLEVNLITYG